MHKSKIICALSLRPDTQRCSILYFAVSSGEKFWHSNDRESWERNYSLQRTNTRDLKQTTTATATRIWKDKRSNWQNNSSARAFQNLVHFLVVLCKTTTWNHHNLRRLRTETATTNCFNSIFNSTLLFYTLCWSWGVAPYVTVNKCSYFLNSN